MTETAPASYAVDRPMLVPPGHVVRTGYVDVFRCRLACRDRMAVCDVASAYGKRIQLGDHSSWPPPRGHWEGDEFVVVDGRREWVQAVMLGNETIFVAWVEGSDV